MDNKGTYIIAKGFSDDFDKTITSNRFNASDSSLVSNFKTTDITVPCLENKMNFMRKTRKIYMTDEIKSDRDVSLDKAVNDISALVSLFEFNNDARELKLGLSQLRTALIADLTKSMVEKNQIDNRYIWIGRNENDKLSTGLITFGPATDNKIHFGYYYCRYRIR